MSANNVCCQLTPLESLRYMNVLVLDHDVERCNRNKDKLKVIIYYKLWSTSNVCHSPTLAEFFK